MILEYSSGGEISRIIGYTENNTKNRIDSLYLPNPDEEKRSYKIYDVDTISDIWKASDTGGTIRVDLNENGEPVGVITENGDLEPPSEQPSPLEQLAIEVSQREINEIIQGRQIADLDIRLLTGGL